MFRKCKKKVLPLLIVLTMLAGFIPGNIVPVYADNTTLTPVADAFFENYFGTDTMFGTGDESGESLNWIGNYESSFCLNQVTAMKFDISGVSGGVDSAILKIYVTHVVGAATLSIYTGSSDSLDETDSSTFPSATGSALFTNQSVAGTGWVSFDITGFIDDEVTNYDTAATIVLTGPATGDNCFAIASDEDPTYAPQLFINYTTNTPPTISAITDKTTNEDTATDPINITIGDTGYNPTAAGSLILSAASDNTTLLPAGSYIFGGSGENRTLTITPAANKSGTANVTVTVKDEYNATATSTFTLTVNAVNDPPVAVNFTKTGNEDTSIYFTMSDFVLKWTDVDGDSMTKAKFTGLPANGTLVLGSDPITLDQEIATNQLSFVTFIPNADWNGTTSFTWQGNDGTAFSSNATVTITVNPINDAPIVTNFTRTANEDTDIIFAQSDFTAEYSDTEGSALAKIKITALPQYGTLATGAGNIDLNGEVAESDLGSLRYIPEANWNGSDSFTWQGYDGSVYSGNGTVNISITAVNDAPEAPNGSLTTDINTAKTGNLQATDIDTGAGLTYSVVTTPAHGTVNINTDGSYTYTPAANYSGADSFTWKANDGTADSNTATMNITVNADVTPPTVSSASPLDNATNIGVNANLVITFSENVVKGTGYITIKKSSDDSVIETIAVTSEQVTGDGTSTITIDPSVTLDSATEYYVLIDATAFDDISGNSFIGVASTTAWSFTTVEAAAYGSFSFSNATYSVAENGGSVAITVNRTGGSDGIVTVNYTTTNNTATGGSDYTATSGSLTFSDGETSKTITINIFDDTHYEGNETVNLTLSNPLGGAELGGTSSAVLTIIDNEESLPDPVSINRQTPADESTNSASVVYRITFSKNVLGVDITDFTLTKTGNANGNIASVSAESGSTMDVTVDTITGEGTLRLDLNNTGTGITDNEGNAISGGFTTGQIYTVDRTPPTGTLSINNGSAITTSLDVTLSISSSDTGSGVMNMRFSLDGNSWSPWLAVTITEDGNLAAGYGLVTVYMQLKDNAGNISGSITDSILYKSQPAASNSTKNGTEDTTVSFIASDFPFSNADTTPLDKVKITSLPANGTLKLGSASISVNDEISVGDLSQINFVPNMNWKGSTSFNWAGYTADGLSTSEATVTITLADDGDADITGASVTITAPVLGATPQDAAAVQTTTNNADYTVTGLTWNEALTAGGKFKAGQVYTATVTLTSKNGKKFQTGAFTPAAAGSASVGTTTTTGGDVVGNTVSFTVTYAATGALEVSSITVTTQPAKMSYTEATDTVLALNGMQITETNNDGSINVVNFTNGTATGYTANPANGATLTNATHNGKPVAVTHTASGKTADTNNLTVNMATSGGGSANSNTVPVVPVITVTEVKSELFSNAGDVKVEADVSSAFGQSVAVKITDITESQKEIFSLAGTNDRVYPFDISLLSRASGEKVQPKDGYSVKVTLPVPEKLLEDRENIKVVYGKNDKLETLKSQLFEKDGKWYITFEAVHFSPYALIVSAEPVKPWTNPFSDLKEGNWYYSAVQYVVQNGLMNGTGSNTFSPEITTSRGMIATILYRLNGYSETVQSTFNDVKPGAYYANAVAWAQQKGIITGYGNGMFGPDDSITREQLATMLWKYAGSPAAADSKGLAAFMDAGEISSYAKNAMAWASQMGIINGNGGGLLDPKGKASRAEVAQIMQNFMQKAVLTK